MYIYTGDYYNYENKTLLKSEKLNIVIVSKIISQENYSLIEIGLWCWLNHGNGSMSHTCKNKMFIKMLMYTLRHLLNLVHQENKQIP